ncbi:hypothetical protein DL766_005721 [Monosporascus sp. MC13-8B]|uniref:Extracellular membrane protein CFEM domain-containing protein n=1 Tax=Monosporascus cannonballus TaxID=155416 RepID=A0ABY0GXY3_9PEZI|nr:hypothetical protein DL762_009464 [Monosporascus cannonballus]RYO86068.1 hypothetical protein DL763_006849 [Monosporascus cannonballus]RYP28762.1 hypothetical protein DL766_005721 [Monosporascus sp. MC13-8B]
MALSSILLPLLALLPQTPVVGATAARAECVHARGEAFAEAAACGDKGSLRNCFDTSPSYVPQDLLERCFERAGCTPEEAVIEAGFIVKQCDDGEKRGPEAELRRRSFPTSMPATMTMPLVVGRQDATTAAPPLQFQPAIQCSSNIVITTQSCPVQSTGTASGQRLDCFDAPSTTQVCKAENICMKDKTGVDICMKREDAITGSALVFTIILAIVFAGGFATLIALCVRDKRTEKRLAAQKEAAAIAKANVVETSAAPTGPRRPLRTPSAGSQRAGGDPFNDPSRMGL